MCHADVCGRATAKDQRMSKQPDKHLGVLYIDDGSSECDVVRGRLQATELFRLVEARSLEALNHRLAQESFDLVLSELKPWGLAELRILEIVRIARAMTPVVIVTASGSEDWAVEAMKRGASDYIPKTPGFLERLPGRLLDAAEKICPERRDEPRERLVPRFGAKGS